jgi:hypothetical protein
MARETPGKGPPVTLAGGLALIIIGAIVRFAVTWKSSWIDISTLGVILMVGGAVGLLGGMAIAAVRRRDRARATVFEQRLYNKPPEQ